MEAIHASGVFGWIEHPDIPLPHSQAGEPSICGSLSQDLAAVGIPLNSDNWLMPEDEIGKESPSRPGEQVHGSQFTSTLSVSRNQTPIHSREQKLLLPTRCGI